MELDRPICCQIFKKMDFWSNFNDARWKIRQIQDDSFQNTVIIVQRIKISNLNHFGVKSLTHFYTTMQKKHRSISVNMH